jgi:hypothetical protein
MRGTINLQYLCKLGKTDSNISVVELGVNISQEVVTDDPVSC